MHLTDEQARDLEGGVRQLAAEGNPLAVELTLRLAECDTPEERAALLSGFADRLQEMGPALATAVQGLAATIAGTLGPALQATLAHAEPILHDLHSRYWGAYYAAAAPYGESEDGLLRWLGEVSELAVANEREEREWLREWSAMDVRHFRETGEHLPPPERDEVL